MNYQQTVDYLYHCAPAFEHVGASAYKEGLDNTHALDAHFGHPHRAYPTIHIAGTNGKGSCSHTIAAILQAAGYKVGLYTSPHLVDFTERIRVNGKPMSHQRVIDFVEQEREFFEPLHPSFFELVTAMAFLYFKEQQVDVAVIEVGLGGRLDCTNIITPVVSIITNISFDHTQFLGNTLPLIAGEKAGIIKPRVPVVVGEDLPETRPVFMKKAQDCDAPIVFAQDEPEVTGATISKTGGIDYETRHFGAIHGQLGGGYQAKNANTILTAVRRLQGTFAISTDNIREGFAHVAELTGLRGRWEVLHQKPLVICDTGHNVGGWQYLAPQIKAQPCRHRLIVFGMVSDKDINTVLSLLPRDATYFWTQASTPRAIPVEDLKAMAEAHQLKGETYDNVGEAYDAAMAAAHDDDFIFVGGSSYIVADLLASKEL